VLGVLIFICTEIMFFGGLMSAFAIVKASAVDGIWPPLGEPLLPAGRTALATLGLLVSAYTLQMAGKAYEESPELARRPLQVTVGLGVAFVLFQVVEWVSLLGQGLTFTSSNHGSFFYFIVGGHGLHVLCGLGVLLLMYRAYEKKELDSDAFWAGRIFWYFVTLLWPFLYYAVYL
jgi:heme/copper-type cytochrome/quinol oxidase subunit 3